MTTFEATPFAEPPALDWTTLARERAVALDPALEPALQASDAGQSNRERLLRGALCVTTGQQPGLFTGPLFTLYKALSAIDLAHAAEAALGRPVVPVFWVAGDDHDFAEANHLHVLDGPGELHRIELRQRDETAALTPLYRERLGPEVDAAMDRLRALLPENEFRSDVLGWLGRHYRADTDFATAFGGALAELLGPLGLVVFQGSHPAAKRVMAPWLRRAITDAEELGSALAAWGAKLASSGRDVPVTVGDGATMVMIEGSLGRDRLVLRDTRFATRRAGESWEAAQLIALLEREPERFSPNVLLRPVVEAAILPTLGYAGGPGELSYLSQCEPLYRGLGVSPQARIPRWSGRLLEARVIRTLEKVGITADVLGQEGNRLETELLRDEIPAPAREAIQSLRTELDREYARILGAAVEIDPTLLKPVESARNAALAGLTDIEKRMIGHLRKKGEIVTTQISRARTSLFPRGQPQERVIATVSFLARYGMGFVEQAAAAVRERSLRLEPAQRRP